MTTTSSQLDFLPNTLMPLFEFFYTMVIENISKNPKSKKVKVSIKGTEPFLRNIILNNQTNKLEDLLKILSKINIIENKNSRLHSNPINNYLMFEVDVETFKTLKKNTLKDKDPDIIKETEKFRIKLILSQNDVLKLYANRENSFISDVVKGIEVENGGVFFCQLLKNDYLKLKEFLV